MDPDQVVAWCLEGVADLALGTDLFRGRVRPAAGGVPVRAVFVEAQGGGQNSRYLGTGRKVRELSVQVRVRSEPGDSAGGRDLAVQVHAALDHLTAGSLAVGYIDCRCDQPFPVELDQDELGAHEWSVNLTLRYAGPIPQTVSEIWKPAGAPAISVAVNGIYRDYSVFIVLTRGNETDPAQFSYSFDTGATWVEEDVDVSEGNISVLAPGLTVGWPVGTYEAGLIYSFTAYAG